MSEKYREAGVDLEAGYESVRLIKSHVARTKVLGAVDSIGAFGGMFDLSSLNYKEPILVSGTDGVGTKLKLAFELDKHDTIGIDAVAMCVNDVLAQGAEPLYFFFFFAVGHNEPAKIEAIVKKVYGGDGVDFAPNAQKQLQALYKNGFDKLPVCVAKTQYSFSDDATKLGAPENFRVTVKNVKVSAGAGFIVVLTGEIMTMPGLPKVPSAEKIDVSEDGKIVGLF